MTSIKLEYLEEPKLQFGHFFEHEDTKTGLAEFGPFGKNIAGLHPSAIRLGFIGTRETIAAAKEWIGKCGSFMESENSKLVGARRQQRGDSLFSDQEEQPAQLTRLEKILNRDFVGFNLESPFQCCFQMNERWERPLQSRILNATLQIEDKEKRIWELVNLFDSEVESLAKTSPSPDIIILALTPEVVEQAHAVRISGNFYLNFRRAIKGRSMRWGIPLQLLQQKTALGIGKGLQEKSLRAWNFCTAQYYTIKQMVYPGDQLPWEKMPVMWASVSMWQET